MFLEAPSTAAFLTVGSTSMSRIFFQGNASSKRQDPEVIRGMQGKSLPCFCGKRNKHPHLLGDFRRICGKHWGYAVELIPLLFLEMWCEILENQMPCGLWSA